MTAVGKISKKALREKIEHALIREREAHPTHSQEN
jgi:hypothetical protein